MCKMPLICLQAAIIVAEKAPMRGEVHNLAPGAEGLIHNLAPWRCQYSGIRPRFNYAVVYRNSEPERVAVEISRLEARRFRRGFSLPKGPAPCIEWFQVR